MSDVEKAAQKAQLRKSLNSWRSQFAVHLAEHPEDRLNFQQEIATQLIALCGSVKPQRIACYLPFGGEPDTSAFIQWALQSGIIVLLPVANADNTMHWVEYDGVSTKKSIYGFAEPHGETVTLEPVDLIILPALAIDHLGNRLGKGKGYYDRELAGLSTPTAAVVYEHELLTALPAEAHDQPVKWVVTPARVLELGR